MVQLADFFASVGEDLAPALVGALPDGVTVTFQLSGDGGGDWTIARQSGDVVVRRGVQASADCKLICSAEAFRGLLSGDLDSRHGFLDGTLKVEGDVGLVLRLEQWVVRRVRQRADP